MPRGKAAGGQAAAKKPRGPKAHQLAVKFQNGEVLRDLTKKNWKIGDVIGQGGFGLIYLASEADSSKVGSNAEYVVKIEPKANGPLFCELHFYQRIAKPDLIDGWIKSKKLKYLGVPRYIASGQHAYNGEDYRFMVMERFSTDLQKVFEDNGKLFPKQAVYAIALRMIDALEYLHENGYIHADIKASNCLLGFKKGKIDSDSVHLVDFGLAAKYAPNDKHREYKEDPRKAHDGTIEFTSIDAHKGVDPSRRGDMEILGYCVLQWLCSKLPWEDKLLDKNYVRDSKIKYMNDIPSLTKKCFPKGGIPSEVSSYLSMVKQLKYDEKPNYNKMRDIFVKGLSGLGIKDTWKLYLPVGGTTKKSPKKAVKRQMNDSDFDAPASKLKACAASPRPSTPKTSSRPGTPKATTKPSTSKTAAKPSTSTKVTKPGTPKTITKPNTPKTTGTKTKPTTPKGRPTLSSASSAKKTVKSPVAPRVTSPAAAKARKIGAKAAEGILSPLVTNGSTKRSATPSAGSPAPKKRKVVRRKHVQMSEMSVQTSPGLKNNR
ncbi:Serine/threonine-protein kinase vrk1 [Mactra antiquata]